MYLGELMEEKRGILSHFSGIIRLIAFIVLLVILLFFVFRWVANRRAENRAEQAVKTAVNSTNKEKESNTTDQKKTEQQTDQKGQKVENQGVVEIPSGVSDSDAPAPTTSKVPSAGIGEDILLTTFFISFSAYLVAKNYTLYKQTKSLV
jgi:cytoskeletal protein RodZ